MKSNLIDQQKLKGINLQKEAAFIGRTCCNAAVRLLREVVPRSGCQTQCNYCSEA